MKISSLIVWLLPLALFILLAQMEIFPWVILNRSDLKSMETRIAELQAAVKEAPQSAPATTTGWGTRLDLNTRR
jgi:hypothetical protein